MNNTMIDTIRELAGDDGITYDTAFEAASLKKDLAPITYSMFSFERILLFDHPFLVARAFDPTKASTLLKLLREVSFDTGLDVICSIETLTPYMRRTFIREKQAFVSDDGQMFIPRLLSLRSSATRKGVQTSRTAFSRSAKLAFLFLLYHAQQDVTASHIMEACKMSQASTSRALEEVHSIGALAKSVGGPRNRTVTYRVENVEEFAAAGNSRFGKAVKEHFLVSPRSAQELPLCGLSALAQRSMLAAPQQPMFAATVQQAKKLKEEAIAPSDAENAVRVFALTYNPAPFVADGVVDLFTMLKTIDRSDERIELAIEEATKEQPWLRQS